MVLGRVKGRLARLRAPFVDSRVFALLAGWVFGVGVALAAYVLAHPSFEALTGIALGVGGSTYYLLHYERIFPESRDSFGRAFVRIYATIWIFYIVWPEGAPRAVVLAETGGVAALLLLIIYSTGIYAHGGSDSAGASRDNE